MNVGIIGVGHLGSHLAEGLGRSRLRSQVTLSPRNREISRRIAEQYGFCLAEHNAQVVTQSEVVCLCTRPTDLLEVAKGLPWREAQVAVSVAPGVRRADIGVTVSPATAVRVLPITAAQLGECVSCMYPEHAAVRELFESFGFVRVLESESEFDVASVHGVMYSVSHAVLATLARWFRDAGLRAEDARLLSAGSVRAAASMILSEPGIDLDSRVAEFASTGSLTELALGRLEHSDTVGGLQAALTVALRRTLELADDART